MSLLQILILLSPIYMVPLIFDISLGHKKFVRKWQSERFRMELIAIIGFWLLVLYNHFF